MKERAKIETPEAAQPDASAEYANQCRAYSEDWGDSGDHFVAMKLGDALCDLDDRIRALELALHIDAREPERAGREWGVFFNDAF